MASVVVLPFIDISEILNYEKIYTEACNGNVRNGLSIDSATNILRRSNLPQDVLARIWQISFISNTPTMPFPEFCLAMYLTKLVLNGGFLPNSLPPEVFSQIQQSNQMILQFFHSQQPSILPQQTGYSSISLNSPMTANSVPTNFSSPTNRVWAIGSEEKQRYDSIFRAYDPQNTGFISGDRAKIVFLQSGLAEGLLSHIWNLADTHGSGKLNTEEFAVAMHLVYAKLQGKDLPSQLPPELIPPSTRDFNNMANFMKTQVISDILDKQGAPKRPSPFNSSISLNDPLLNTSAQSSRRQSILNPEYSSMPSANIAEDEERKKRLLQELDARKVELHNFESKVRVSTSTVSELDSKIKKLEKSILDVNNSTLRLQSINVSLEKQAQQKPNPSSSASMIALMHSGDNVKEIRKLISECLEFENELHSLKTSLAKKRDAKRNFGNASAVVSPLPSNSTSTFTQILGSTVSTNADPVASKAAALLAQRMAALGMATTAVPLSPVVPSSNSSGSDLHAELAKIDEERRKREFDIREIEKKVNILCGKMDSAKLSPSGPSLKPNVAKKWNPSVDQRIKYEDGIGMKTNEGRELIEKLKLTSANFKEEKDDIKKIPEPSFPTDSIRSFKSKFPDVSASTRTQEPASKFPEISSFSTPSQDQFSSLPPLDSKLSNIPSESLFGSTKLDDTFTKTSFNSSFAATSVNDAISMADAALNALKSPTTISQTNPTPANPVAAVPVQQHSFGNVGSEPKPEQNLGDNFFENLRKLQEEQKKSTTEPGFSAGSTNFLKSSLPSALESTEGSSVFSSAAIKKKPPPPPPSKKLSSTKTEIAPEVEVVKASEKSDSDFEAVIKASKSAREAAKVFESTNVTRDLKDSYLSDTTSLTFNPFGISKPSSETTKSVTVQEEIKPSVSVKSFAANFNPFGPQATVQKKPSFETEKPPVPKPVVNPVKAESDSVSSKIESAPKPPPPPPVPKFEPSKPFDHQHSFSSTLDAIKARRYDPDSGTASEPVNPTEPTPSFAPPSPAQVIRGPPPPPPPLPPTLSDGTFAPIKIAPQTSASSTSTPKRKPTPAEVGAVGPSLFALPAKPSVSVSSSAKVSSKIKSLQGTVGSIFGASDVTGPSETAIKTPEPVISQAPPDESDWEVVNNSDFTKSALSSPEKSYQIVEKPIAEEISPPPPPTLTVLFQVRALFDFEGSRSDELQLVADDIVDVLRDDGGDWIFGRKNGIEGVFPRNYTTTDLNVAPVVPVEEIKGYAEVLFDFEKTRDDEVSLSTGEIVSVRDWTESSWWTVEKINGERGLAPSTYLKELEKDSGEALWTASLDGNGSGGAGGGFNSQGGKDDSYNDKSHYSGRYANNKTQDTFEESGSGYDRYDGNYLSTSVSTSRSRNLSARSTGGIIPSSSFSGPLVSAAQQWAALVDPDVMHSMSVEERKRQEAIFEIVSTESSYVRDLQLIVEIFYQPMSQFMKQSALDNIFANIEEILLTNSIILSDLETLQESQGYVVEGIGHEFTKHISSLGCYSKFCENQLNSTKYLQRLRQDDRQVGEFLKACFKNPKCRSLDLTSFLLQPMQRITRYALLFKQVLHHTPESHPDYEAIERAIQLVEEVAENVNLAARDRENQVKIEKIAKQLDMDTSELQCKLDLRSPTRILGKRQLIHEGPLMKGKSGRKLQGYLFNDLLLLAEPAHKPTGGSTAQSKHSVSRGYDFFLYRNPLPLNECFVRDIGETEFNVVHVLESGEEEQIGLKVAKPAERKKWVESIETQTRLYRTKEKQKNEEMKSSAKSALRSKGADSIIGTVEVRIHEANRLATGNKLEVFAIVQLNQQVQKTRTSKDFPNPKWNQGLLFSVQSLDETLLISLYNLDKFSPDEYLGSTDLQLDLLEYYNNRETERMTLNMKDVHAGSVVISLWYRPL